MAGIIRTPVKGRAVQGLDRRGAGVLISLMLAMLAGALSGCAPARLDKVIIHERLAQSGEYQMVQVIREGQPVAVSEAMNLKPGDELKTDSTSTAVISFLEGTRVVARVMVKPDSRVKIFNPDIKLKVILGEIYAWIMEKGKFAVQGEYVEVTPQGTEFYMRVEESQNVDIVVINGRIRLASRTGQWSPIIVNQFQQGVVSGQDKPVVSMATREQINSLIQEINTYQRLIQGQQSRMFVPDVVGLSEIQVRGVIQGAGCMPGKIKRAVTGQSPVGVIIKQNPGAGAWTKANNRIDMVVEAEPADVPSLKGASKARALEALNRAGLSAGRIQEEITGRYPPDTVLRQEPQAGTVVPKLSSVDLWIEAESVVVPDLRRLNIQEARRRLERARLRPGRVEEKMTGAAKPKTILDQHPSPGTRLSPGTEVAMSMEVESVVVPRVERRSFKEAMEMVRASQLNFRRVREEITGTVTPGVVLRQTPRPGTRVALDTVVELVVEAESVLVPNVMGRHIDAARRFVQQARLQPSDHMEYTGRATRNTVIRQSPGAGTRVRPNSVVTLSVEGAYFLMPNFISMREEQARRLLKERGITQVQMHERATGSYPAGTIMDQYPRPGTPVRSLGQISLVIARKKLCIVPEVRQRTVNEAKGILHKAGFAPQPECSGSPKRCDPRYNQPIYNQSPSAGTRAPCGSPVIIYYHGIIY